MPRSLLFVGVLMVLSCGENAATKNERHYKMAYYGPVLDVDVVKRQLTIDDEWQRQVTFTVPDDDIIVVQSPDGERQRFAGGLKGIKKGTNLWIEHNQYVSGKGKLQAVVFLPKELEPKRMDKQ
jgi:hypothetical protein